MAARKNVIIDRIAGEVGICSCDELSSHVVWLCATCSLPCWLVLADLDGLCHLSPFLSPLSSLPPFPSFLARESRTQGQDDQTFFIYISGIRRFVVAVEKQILYFELILRVLSLLLLCSIYVSVLCYDYVAVMQCVQDH